MLWEKMAFCPEEDLGSKWRDKIPGRGEIMGLFCAASGGNRKQPTTNITNTDNKRTYIYRKCARVAIEAPDSSLVSIKSNESLDKYTNNTGKNFPT